MRSKTSIPTTNLESNTGNESLGKKTIKGLDTRCRRIGYSWKKNNRTGVVGI